MSVGAICTTIDFTIFALLHLFLGIPTVMANTIAYSAGSINSFSLHRLWTFKDRPKQTIWIQFSQFFIVGVGALLINNLVISLAPQFISPQITTANGDLVAKVFGTGLGIIWNFSINYFWTFRKIY